MMKLAGHTGSALAYALAGLLSAAAPVATGAETTEQEVVQLIRQDVPYALVPPELFERLGWEVPDGGRHVKALAEAAPGGAFDPAALETLPAQELGYRAKWRVLRYTHYGIEWDITGLYLEPTDRLPGLPTLVQIHGGSGNWYQFFVEPRNGPGFGQYLAQKIPVLLVTIPGNYRPGGFELPPSERQPAYLLDGEPSESETRARNAVFTFSLIADGVARLVEQATRGPVLISGHSTGGELQFMLKERLKHRLRDLSLGWGTGGPARLRRAWADTAAAAHNRGGARRYRPISEIRARVPAGYTHGYIGPFNVLLDEPSRDIYSWYFRVISEPDLMMNMAEKFFERESRRKPFFKQHIQDLEHTGVVEHREQAERTIREAVARSGLPIDADQAIADLLATVRTPLDGYRRMIWTTSMLDEGHWDPEPARARELFVANQYRAHNQDAEIRVLVYDTLMTHVGYMEKPRQLAGGTLAAVMWLYEEEH